MMNEKRKQLLNELETLGEYSDFRYKNFWITKSPLGGFTVVKHAYLSSSISCEHFSNAQRVVDFLSRYDKSLKTLYEVKL